jgi:predicted ATPase
MLQLQKQWNVTMRRDFDDLTDEAVFKQHGNLLCTCGNVVLAKQFKRFVIDDNNRDIIHFLLYYFNNCKKAEDVFPGKGYTIHKNLMICGEVGVGKTMLMQVFADYLKRTGNPNAFVNLSVTQMINYYKMHNHLDKYTYNEDGTQSFEGKPFNVCLNDVGLQTHLHFGTDTKVLVTDFFHARNEIWAQQGKFAHITTNLTASELKEYFADGYGRLEDRFKTYNVIHLKGKSRR